MPAASVAPAPRVQGTDAAREAETIVDSDAGKEFLDAALHALGSRVVVTEVERIRELLASHHHAFSREQEPFAVLLPGSAHEVSVILRLADERRIAVFTRGAGTGLGGLSTIDRQGVLLLTDRLNRIRCINPLGHYAVVEAGVVNARINDVAAQYGLWYAPDPVSRDRSTIGGDAAADGPGSIAGFTNALDRAGLGCIVSTNPDDIARYEFHRSAADEEHGLAVAWPDTSEQAAILRHVAERYGVPVTWWRGAFTFEPPARSGLIVVGEAA